MSSGHGAKFPRKATEAIDALLRCTTIEDAAKETEVCSRTFRRWMKEPEFIEEYTKRRVEASRHAMTRMQAESSQAFAVVLAILYDLTAPGAVRLKAAKIVLEGSKEASKIDEANLLAPPLEHIVGGTFREGLRGHMRSTGFDPDAPDEGGDTHGDGAGEVEPE